VVWIETLTPSIIFQTELNTCTLFLHNQHRRSPLIDAPCHRGAHNCCTCRQTLPDTTSFLEFRALSDGSCHPLEQGAWEVPDCGW
jgi:hypothetical protein